MPTNKPDECPICGETLGNDPRHLGTVDAYEYSCRVCGDYRLDRKLTRTPPFQMHADLTPYLSAYIRQSNKKGVIPELSLGNWKELAHSHAQTPIEAKMSLVLGELGKRAPKLGTASSLNSRIDYPLFDASGHDEVDFLLDTIRAKGWIREPSPSMGRNWEQLVMTIEGWTHLEDLNAESQLSNTCFVAMSFGAAMTPAYEEAICPAIEVCGFRPDRVDRRQFNNKICDEIIAGIRKCRFMVADFTGHRGGVYFEAGFAQGLGRPVIFTCRDTDIEDAHFDTNHYNHIVWTSPDDFRRKLSARIEATIA